MAEKSKSNSLSLEEHWRKYNQWKYAAGFGSETAEDVLFGKIGKDGIRKGGLSGEIGELKVEIDNKNPFGIAGEIIDVLEFSGVLAEKYGVPIYKLPLVDGRPANNFKELQEQGKRILQSNGHHTPIDHIHEVLDDIEELKKVHKFKDDRRIEIVSRMILHSAVIMQQLGIPMEKVVAAKDKRNADKYDPQNIELTSQLYNIPVRSYDGISAIDVVRSEWDKRKDDGYTIRELGILGSARLYLANTLWSFKKNMKKIGSSQLLPSKKL